MFKFNCSILVPNRSNSPTYRPPPRTKEVIINNQSIKLKYCFTCKIFRPPRASHCSLCDNCVGRFPVLLSRDFWFQQIFQNVLIIIALGWGTVWANGTIVSSTCSLFRWLCCASTYLLALSRIWFSVCTFYPYQMKAHHFVSTVSKGTTMIEAIKKSPISLLEGVICFFSVWSILGLAGFHTYLILSNLTTNEDVKGSFSSKRNNSLSNPYSMGSAWRNCLSILCGPHTPR